LLDLAPDPTDQHVYSIGNRIEVVIPHVIEQLTTAQYSTWVPHQILKQGILTSGEPNPPACAASRPRGGVEHQITEFQRDGQSFARAAG